MRRIKYLIFFLLLCPLLTLADGAQVTTFGSATSGARINEQGSGIGYHQLIWTVTGTVSACTVAIDSSANGTDWSAGAVLTAQTCTSNGSSVIVASVANYVKVTTASWTGTGSVKVVYKGYVVAPNKQPRLCAFQSSTLVSNATIGLFGAGSSSVSGGTYNANTGGGYIITAAGTLRNLHARASAGGVNGSDGVLTLMVNGSAPTSGLTCTFGTGTTCDDVANVVTVAVGDKITYRIVSQTSSTLANVAACAEVW